MNIWPEQRDKLWVSGFSASLSNDELREFLERFGSFVHMFRTKYKTDVFVTYFSEENALLALNKLKQENITARYAYDKRGAQLDNLNGASHQPDGNQRRVRFSNGNPDGELNGRRTSGPSKQEVPQKKVAVFRSGEEVIITYVKDFHFYAYPKAKEHEYERLLRAISQSATNAEQLKAIPQHGDLVLVPCNGDFCRALVLKNDKSQSDFILVTIIDFGFTAEVPYHEMKVLPEKFFHIRFTYRFTLDTTFDTDNLYAVECFKSFVKSTLKMESDETTVKPSSKVKLIEPDTNECINELIKQMTLKFTFDEMKKSPAPIGENKELTVIDVSKLKDGFNLITFVEQSMNLECYRQRNQAQIICKILETFPPHLPSENELCFVHFNDYWYRATFLEKNSETTAIVLLVDIQKAVQVELKNIRNITEAFAKEPALTFTAALHGNNSKISKEKVTGLMYKFKIGDDICVKSIIEGPEILCVKI